MTGRGVSLTGISTISAILTNTTVPSNIKGIKGKSFELSNANINFKMTFDCSNGSNIITQQPALSLDLNSIGKIKSFSNTSITGNLTIDASFNVVLTATAIWSPNGFSWDIPISKIPIIGPACLSVDLNAAITPKVKAQLVVGIDQVSGNWGFLQNTNGDVTELFGKIKATASIRGKVQAVCGFSLIPPVARASIDATIEVGGGVQYATIPSINNKLFGGYIDVTGSIEILGGWWKAGPATLYSSGNFGNPSAYSFKTSSYYDPFLDFSAQTYQLNSAHFLPQDWPTGTMSSRDSILSVVWVDDVNAPNGKYLFITYFDPITNTISAPGYVASNDSLITEPSVALLPSKRSLVTWVQSNYESSQIDTSIMTIDDVSSAQDIWFAICDNSSTNPVLYKAKLTDSNGNAESGPKITWGPSTEGIITWEVADPSGLGNEIYFTRVMENGNNYSFSAPKTINAGLTGFNYNLQISYYGAIDAIAEWINDGDMNDSTGNNIYYSTWDGTTWTTPQARYTINIPSLRIKENSFSVNAGYGIEALTYEYTDSIDEILINGAYLAWWDNSNPHSYKKYYEEDSLYTYQIPRTALSDNGIASLIIQTRDHYDITDIGQLNLIMKDLKNATDSLWQDVTENSPQYLSFITDTNYFVWDLASTFGYLQSASSPDIMYLFSQEMDTLGTTNPSVVFGNPNLNLALRAFQCNSNNGNITLNDVPDPNTNPVSVFYQNLGTFNYDMELKQNFPNPFNKESTIPLHVRQAGKAKIDLFDIAGKLIATILDESLSPGFYEIRFDSGNLQSGIYFYTMSLNNSSTTKKMIITK